MAETVERCTDALLRAFFSRPVEGQRMSITAMDHHDLVRAMIAEMRQPTLAMMNALDDGEEDAGLEQGWRMAIDAALK